MTSDQGDLYPAFQIVLAKDKYENPNIQMNELWQTGFIYFKVIDWDWYYLSTVLDDYSRYILGLEIVIHDGCQ